MNEPEGARRVKLLALLLWRNEEALKEAYAELERVFGRIDYSGSDHPFDVTNYYEPEMGSGLKRTFISFAGTRDPGEAASLKHAAASVEKKLSVEGRRRVNIDVGYLDPHKLVLLSFKYGAPKIYVGQGVWADPICLYRKGTFQPFAWTFADFKDGRYNKDLLAIRSLYKADLRSGGG